MTRRASNRAAETPEDHNEHHEQAGEQAQQHEVSHEQVSAEQPAEEAIETEKKTERQRRKIPTFDEIRATVRLLTHEQRSDIIPVLKQDLIKDVEEEGEVEFKRLKEQQEKVDRLNKLRNQ